MCCYIGTVGAARVNSWALSRADSIVDELGLPERSDLLQRAAAYCLWTRRGRRFGLLLGLVVGFGPLAGDSNVELVLPRLLAGYLLGLLVVELFSPRARRGSRRHADLAVRGPQSLAPRWARVAPWVVLLLVALAPLLAIGYHPRGKTSFSTWSAGCSGIATWPTGGELAAVAVIGVLGLLVSELTLRRLVRRSRPADDAAATHLDDALRAISARTLLGAAGALGLVLVSSVAAAVSAGANSFVCSAATLRQPSSVGAPYYSWAHFFTPWLGFVSLLLFLAGLWVWWVCSRLEVPVRFLRDTRPS